MAPAAVSIKASVLGGTKEVYPLIEHRAIESEIRRGMLTPLLHLVLLAQALFLFRHVLFSTRYVIPWDLPGYHLPLAYYVASSFREGRLPLWDPYTYCGMPFYGNLQAQVFYPPMWISVWAANWLGPVKLQNILEWQVAIHAFLGGVFCFWLLRKMGLQPGAALFGGILYAQRSPISRRLGVRSRG